MSTESNQTSSLTNDSLEEISKSNHANISSNVIGKYKSNKF